MILRLCFARSACHMIAHAHRHLSYTQTIENLRLDVVGGLLSLEHVVRPYFIIQFNFF